MTFKINKRKTPSSPCLYFMFALHQPAVTGLKIHLVIKGLAPLETPEVFRRIMDDAVERLFQVKESGNMRRDDRILESPQRVLRRQRFGIRYVHTHSSEMS